MSAQQSPHSRSGRARTWPKIAVAFVATAAVTGLVAAGVAMPALGAIGAATNTAVASFQALPDELADPVVNQRTLITDSSNTVIGTYWGDEGNRVTVPLDQISPLLLQAIVAVEDTRFYQHNGVDVRGTVRALATNSGAGEVQQGGSTITQQYVKMIQLNNATTAEEKAAAVERTPERKLKEASLAISLEKRKTKQQILDGYLNIAYYGGGAYGAEIAAQRYFSVPASALTLPQAATLAGVVQQPGAFDPIQHPEAAQARRDVVLNRMYEQGMITAADHVAAIATPIAATLLPQDQPNGCPGTAATYFCDYVLKSFLLDPAFGATAQERQEMLNRGGIMVQTTLDAHTQAAAQQAVLNAIPATDPSGKAVAISMVQPGTGRILAMAQNRTWGLDGAGVTTYNYNVDLEHGGTQGMQAGSTFKVFTMMAALEEGISPYMSIRSPQKRTFTDFRNCDGTRFPPYPVENSTGQGTFNMYTGTAKSVNTYYVALAQMTNLCRMGDIAEAMGVAKGSGESLERVPSFPLGSNEVTPLAMAGAYATIANHGSYCRPQAIDAVHTYLYGAAQTEVYRAQPACTQVVSTKTADTAARILVGVVENGTGKPVAFGRPVAGKTGTTDSNAAVWFDGFTPQVATAVWVGDPRGGFRYPLRNLVINGKFVEAGFGSTLAGPVFKSAMTAAHENLPYQDFTFSPDSDDYPRPATVRPRGSNPVAAPEPETPADPAAPAAPDPAAGG